MGLAFKDRWRHEIKWDFKECMKDEKWGRRWSVLKPVGETESLNTTCRPAPMI